jgi:hypothetical protein
MWGAIPLFQKPFNFVDTSTTATKEFFLMQ